MEPDYIVIRPAAGLPEGFLPRHWDGLWLDRAQIGIALPNLAFETASTAVAGATGRFEVREDGVVAEVFEVQHIDGSPDA
jgi:hypothetical protein